MPRLLTLILLTLLLGCGDELAPMDAGADGGSDPVDAGSDGSAEDVPTPACEGVYVERVVGRALDESGEGILGAAAQVCLNTVDERWLCLSPTNSDSEGRFDIRLGTGNRCLVRVAMRVSADERVTDYCAPPLSADLVDVGDLRVPTPTMEWTLDGVRLAHSSGLVLRASSESEALRLSESVSARAGIEGESCKRANLGFESSVGFTPEGFQQDLFVESVPALGFEEGDDVEVVLLGGLFGELADGSILAEGDGMTIALGTVFEGAVAVDVQLPFLTWLGLRAPR